ncbi:hypothetical protein BST81_23090 [Leptolyngbya sp. 'hensonii']|uniref:hypothetical protein n=1 Tax=Leptolyngbya sp. 'hensonii' TaxID=1922337 RepID=UPI00094FCE6F|nr:hypothetical protein [Leptolyngbya sp. 'hensonii']OLP16112.1 hypothetical protein BST81_23090 [Leptolyngbya sp. 'hensonii']
MTLFWDRYYQQKQIQDVDLKANRAAHEIDSVAQDVAQLQQRVEKLSLGCQALWELLRDHTSLTEDDLVIKMTEIDLRDGKLDGEMGKQILTCPNCRRNSSSKRLACLYCGYALPKNHLFG